MMNNGKYYVSVIVPNYNHAKYLDLRIQSILNQTYQNFELIILDDCSPDDGASRKVIEQYRGNPHVSHIVYNEENSGSTFKQWDKGINLAKGELIWIAESDDFCEPTLLEVLVREFERDEHLTLAYTLLQKVDAEGRPIPYLRRTPCGVTRLGGRDYVRRYMTTCNHCANASSAVFKKVAYQKIDRLYTTYKAGGDKLFWIEIAELGNVAIVNKRLNYFRQHQQKVTPGAVKKGINLIEYKKTYTYVDTHFHFTPFRMKLMRDYAHYLILKRQFESNIIRKELLSYWRLPNVMKWQEKLIIKSLDVLHHRIGLYL
ncbi:MAG: glycosyltransferase [Bacteroidaceae bacterium]|nr:glycosyltransferase [Bacteroidaceae bacterium]